MQYLLSPLGAVYVKMCRFVYEREKKYTFIRKMNTLFVPFLRLCGWGKMFHTKFTWKVNEKEIKNEQIQKGRWEVSSDGSIHFIKVESGVKDTLQFPSTYLFTWHSIKSIYLFLPYFFTPKYQSHDINPLCRWSCTQFNFTTEETRSLLFFLFFLRYRSNEEHWKPDYSNCCRKRSTTNLRTACLWEKARIQCCN